MVSILILHNVYCHQDSDSIMGCTLSTSNCHIQLIYAHQIYYYHIYNYFRSNIRLISLYSIIYHEQRIGHEDTITQQHKHVVELRM